MHHLHPRSGATSTLFTTTLAVSFLVVALPHLLPCPVDRRQFADSVETVDGKPRRRRRRPIDTDAAEEGVELTAGVDASEEGRRKRECPVPKPSGLVGQMMGFKKTEKNKPMDVVVRTLRSRSDGDDGSKAP